MDRQAKKAIMFGLNYGMAGGSSFMRMLIEEQIKMMASMAVSRNTGIGYICLEQPDFSTLELRLLSQMHDEQQVEFITHDIGPRGYSKNQRGRHWDRKRKETQVKAVPKTAQQLLDEDFKNDHTLYNCVHKMGDIQNPPHRQSVACIVVQKGGKIHAHNIHWTGVFQELFN